MSVILSDCIGCANLIRVETDRVNGTTKMTCKAYPNGIPVNVSSADKTKDTVCADGIGYAMKIYKI
jgi:hypothetical protein